MASRTILALAPDPKRTSQIAEALAPAGMTVCQGYSGQEAGRFIRESAIDAVVFAGELPGLTAERILTAVADRLPQAVIIVALEDTAAANAYAARFRGHALPWPLQAAAVEGLLGRAQAASYIVPRREPRFRYLGGALVASAAQSSQGLLLNVSAHGAMVLSEVDAREGATVTVKVPYGADNYILAGTVKHHGGNLEADAYLQAAAWLPAGSAAVLGLELQPQSLPAAAELCRRLHAERSMLNLRVVCIPGVPKGLTPVLTRHHVTVESMRALPASFDDAPPIVLLDVSTCSEAELKRLAQLRRRSVIIGVATTPITDKERAAAAHKLPGLFVLPFQADRLAHHMEEFFGPVDRRFPRIEEPFTVLVRRPGGVVAVEGVNLSLEGCALVLDQPYDPGADIEGTLAMDQSIDAYPFKGRVVYCQKHGGRYRAGVHFALKPAAVASYQRYLSSRFLKQMRQRWEDQLRSAPV